MMVQEIKNFITPHQAKTELPYQPLQYLLGVTQFLVWLIFFLLKLCNMNQFIGNTNVWPLINTKMAEKCHIMAELRL